MVLATKMQKYKRDWKTYNPQLVNRGRIITILVEPSLVQSDSLQKLNKNKVGKPFQFSTGLISAAFVVKCTLRLGYRQLEGFMRDVSDKLHKRIPNFRTIWWRVNKMKNEGLKFNQHEGKSKVIAIDSTGMRPVNDGEYRAMKYDKRREWIKLHAVVDIKTKEIINIKITKGNVHDSVEFFNVVKPISDLTSEILGDKAYDSRKIFEFCKGNDIISTIPVKLNANNTSLGFKSKVRREEIEKQLGLICKPGYNKRHRYISKETKIENQNKWKLNVGYGRRSIVESSFSRYKRLLGENLFSKKAENIEKEITTKINILNKFAVM